MYIKSFFINYYFRYFNFIFYGFYLIAIGDEANHLFFEGICLVVKFINFIININIIYFVFDILMIPIFNLYKYIFDYTIEGKHIKNFISYPIVVIIWLLILQYIIKKDTSNYSVLLKDYGYVGYNKKK